MTLESFEFIRRFLIHDLPKGLHRIRHYGLFANSSRANNLARARELLNVVSSVASTTEQTDHHSTTLLYPYPSCGAPMLIIETFEHHNAPRAPPNLYAVTSS